MRKPIYYPTSANFDSPKRQCAAPERSREAFTLIELLLVLFIITILIGFTVPLIRKVRTSANGASTQAQLVTIANAIQQYYGDFHAYPGPLPNSQLGMAYTRDNSNGSPFVNKLDGVTPVKLNGLAVRTQNPLITGPENLVLGLLGGLELQSDGNSPADIGAFLYNPAMIFPDSVTANPVGAMSLNFSKPKRTPAYLQVRSGDISHPSSTINSGRFADQGSRLANDTSIPEFVDQYPEGLPILYLRANPGGTAIASIGTGAVRGGAPLIDANGNSITAQYDIGQIYGYTSSVIGTDRTNAARKFHGLQGLGNDNLSDPLLDPHTKAPDNNGSNALAYLKDPNNPGTSNVPNSTATPPTFGNARQKDGYILISAGPDRIYGTADDIIYPGTLLP